jgi:hypothetical protein
MPQNPYLSGFSQAELEAKRALVSAGIDKILSQQSLLSAGMGGKSFAWAQERLASLERTLCLLNEALQSMDPGHYGRRVTLTHGDFTNAW